MKKKRVIFIRIYACLDIVFEKLFFFFFENQENKENNVWLPFFLFSHAENTKDMLVCSIFENCFFFLKNKENTGIS